MEKPFGFLLYSIGQIPVMCSRGLANPSTLAKASDGTGPFTLTGASTGQGYTFTVRKGYSWGPNGASTSAAGTPAKIVIQVVQSETTQANLLLAGALNFARITGPDGARLQAQGLKRLEVPTSGAGLLFNQLDGRPTADARVRKALVQALDLNELVKVSTGGDGAAATGLVNNEPKPCPGNTISGQLPQHDVAAARTLLDEAGWLDGADGIRTKAGKPLVINLHYFTVASPLDKPTAELIADGWRKIGVRVTLTQDPSQVEYSRILFETSDYDAYVTAFGFDLPSQNVPYLSGPIPPAGTNVSGINNPDYNRLAAQAQQIVPPASCSLWDQAEKALYRDVDIVPISVRPFTYYLNNSDAEITRLQLPIPTSIRVLK